MRGTKAVRNELAKRGVDATLADIRVMHGVAYIRGSVRPMKEAAFSDLRAEMELIARVLRQKAEIKDVVIDCSYRT